MTSGLSGNVPRRHFAAGFPALIRRETAEAQQQCQEWAVELGDEAQEMYEAAYAGKDGKKREALVKTRGTETKD
jgi:hypothetical protein